MARPVTIPIKQRGKSWQMTVPASISPTGKLWRPSYDTKREAESVRTGLLTKKRTYGVQSPNIRPGLAEDALHAAEILSAFDGVTLAEAAKHYVDARQKREKSVSVSALWAEYLDTKAGISESYAKDLERYGEKVIPALASRNVSELEPLEIEKAIGEAFPTPTAFNNAYRSIRPAWTLAVKRGYCDRNPFERIDQKKKTAKPVDILTLKQVKATLAAAQTDYSKGEAMPKTYRLDCTGCLPAIGLMIFAGVRPKEIERVTWEDVRFDHECIRIDAAAAKTRSSRIIPMSDNLRAWLELTPKEMREGSITPLQWAKKVKAIRYAAGISDTQDAMRHSFASYHLAGYADLNALQEAMGHSTPEMVLKHYRALVHKADAVKFWSIRPKAEKPQLKEVSA